MDIRTYFSSSRKPSSTSSTASANQPTSSKVSRTRIIDSDYDDDEMDNKKKKKTAESTAKNRRKRVIDSSDESDSENTSKKAKQSKSEKKQELLRMRISDSSSEEVSPIKQKASSVKQKSKSINKPVNVKVVSKFFKETSASDVFGNEPVKRNDKKLKEMQDKLKIFKTPKQDLKLNDDAEFEAALDQLDEIGDNWADLSKLNRNKPETNSKENEKSSTRKSAADKQDLKTVAANKDSTKKKVDILDSSSSGYCSADSAALSSDSQTLDSTDLSINPVISKLEKGDTSKKIQTIIVPKAKLRSLVESRENYASSKLDERIDQTCNTPKLKESPSDCFELWVEKYKPQSSKKIIGQQGEKSNANKLINWLNNWYKNNTGSKKPSFIPGGWNKDPTGACFKAALLSGPPGVGKTTTVSLVCKELGFDTVEFNASDTRSKKLLQEEASELLKCTSLTPYFSKNGRNNTAVTKKHVLVMDEVDGMAGNEDRGGIQELIQLIKITKVPIICMCNDRNHPKIRSLVNYCFDLRFSRPRIEQIRGYMMSVCYKEKLQITTEALSDIITSANHDVRLVLNHLSMLAAGEKANLEAAKKYIKLSAWDVLRKVFSKEDHKNMSIHAKCDLFFFDYSIAPLFVQENYLLIKPLNVDAQNKRKKMELFARAAECISIGDRVDLQIRKNSAWSLLPTQAIFASYAPGEILEGYCSAQINFPSWLGKNSKQGRMDRLLQEIQIHTRLKVSASKESVNLDYAPHLKNKILDPLIRHGSDGVKNALDTLHEYDLLKEDLDNLQEICQWPESVNTLSNLDSKVKSAFTRAYNKNPPIRPYSLTAPIKKASTVESLPDEVENVDESEKSDDDTDAMIVMKKKSSTKKSDSNTPSTSTSKKKLETTRSKRSRKK